MHCGYASVSVEIEKNALLGLCNDVERSDVCMSSAHNFGDVAPHQSRYDAILTNFVYHFTQDVR